MSLYIYHEGTGTLISLSDRVYLINDKFVSEDVINDLSEGFRMEEVDHKGYRIDNYNMGNLFFGEPQ